MVRKRGLSDMEPEGSKKRSSNPNPMTPSSTNTKPERSMLNDGLLSLYKKDSAEKKEDAATNNEKSEKPKRNDAECSKTPGRAAKKLKHGVITPTFSTVTFKDVGGMDDMIHKVLRLFFHRKVGPVLGKPQRGILLHGPTGCGKTHFVRAIAGEFQIPILEVAATELVSGISGDSESKIRDIFDAAVACGRCILFIDEIDAICSKREVTENGMIRRMVSQMIKCFDELDAKDPNANVVVFAATNMPDSIDATLRRGTRFSHELAFGIPDEEARLKILKVPCKGKSFEPDFDFEWLAHNTPGYVGVDLISLVSHASTIGIYRWYKELRDAAILKENESIGETSGEGQICPNKDWPLEDELFWFKSLEVSEELPETFCFKFQDFKDAMQDYVPSLKREGFASVPDTTWEDVGALEDIKKELRSAILWPVKYHKLYDENKFSSTKGILLYGPKGCGKTLLAKAVANECSINFLAVNGPELLSMYVGESEKAVRRVFERARNSAPCVIFFDEFDALCPPRSSSKENVPVERVVNQLLTETCGLQDRKQVFLVAATNRLEKIDSAMLRPGRLEKILYVGLPTPEGREAILNSQTKNKTSPKIEETLTFNKIAADERCNNYSGADLAYLIREATSTAVEEMIMSGSFEGECILRWEHFDKALNVVKPSFSEQDRKYFERMSSKHIGV
ncbi:hypothetical protein JTE90_022712 [Oedothorax gibbosus]|uniref:AAA+ ATPase domain-containing protein n=1 Tax=Oedothorax gibbosus TaxID=931172 RepID=A0AAV6UPZ5_9ARAC|nr:hypothetical protein JTE90_022712 [Oedothorax gibbosus]